ncbi:uncharacterized protein LY89DRAFT_669130 [Mollisia scopiformis]|uniref:Uncharacterized protein n=1 Tax=Mollisia scopiformis TaxID=149040 RepID=A0A194XA73_MOLSC|nr:uncharacterized protein LY89DRAFT_669130 [Mollisia scopiformis]KUJ16662.1 hypothetical protein LY89DRAFT_669130 [Mollisia scopiformis]
MAFVQLWGQQRTSRSCLNDEDDFGVGVEQLCNLLLGRRSDWGRFVVMWKWWPLDRAGPLERNHEARAMTPDQKKEEQIGSDKLIANKGSAAAQFDLLISQLICSPIFAILDSKQTEYTEENSRYSPADRKI